MKRAWTIVFGVSQVMVTFGCGASALKFVQEGRMIWCAAAVVVAAVAGTALVLKLERFN